ncbi:MAG: GNAT family N-acetyltransferase [Spirochaetaceae bacterium]|nr:GNAT family N-acetyltransferase [Spirochaetaceae bacterium]
MEIKLEPEISLKEYQMLRGTTSWAKLTDRQVKKLLKHSAFKVRAKADGKTVGMARIIFDYGYTAYVSDVIVLADFQGHGIGKMMMEDLLARLKAASEPGGFLNVVLQAAPGKSGFYEKLGFTKRTEETGWGMCLRYNSN